MAVPHSGRVAKTLPGALVGRRCDNGRDWKGGIFGAQGKTEARMQIRSYQPEDEEAVVRLWEACGLTRPWNDPRKDIARKLTEHPELFLVGDVDGQLMATAMVGYEG